MEDYRPPQLEMTPDGRFRAAPRASVVERIGRTALVVALLAGVIAAALLALWFALALIPVAIGAGIVAWLAFAIQRALARRGR